MAEQSLLWHDVTDRVHTATTFGSLKFEKIEKQVSAEVKLETVLGLQCVASLFSIA